MKIIIIFLALSNEVFWQKSRGASSTHHPRRHSHLYIIYLGRARQPGWTSLGLGSAAPLPLRPPPPCAANQGILYYFFCNKTSHRQRSPCSKSETIAQNLLRLERKRERESSCYLSWGSGPECCDPYLGPLIPNCSVLCPAAGVYELLQVGNAWPSPSLLQVSVPH